MSRTLASFLADLSGDELDRMARDIQKTRERLKAEDDKLAFEEQLVQEARSRKARRSGGSGRVVGNRMTKERVLDIINRTFTGQFNSTHVVQAFADEGVETNGESLRQHIRRLADEGRIAREGKGFVPLAALPTSGLDDEADHTSSHGLTDPGEDHDMALGVGSRNGSG